MESGSIPVFFWRKKEMAWVHQYQYAEISPSLYPKLRGMALPIIRYEVQEDKIIAVELGLKDNQRVWVERENVTLYRSGKELISIPETKGSLRKWRRFLKQFSIRG